MRLNKQLKGKGLESVSDVILGATVGSKLYGTYREGSDIDRMEVCILSLREYLCNPSGKRSWAMAEGGVDSIRYEAAFFIRLCANCNMNVLSLLWSNVDLVATDLGKKIVDSRQRFITKQLADVGVGFCLSNLKDVEDDNRATGKLGDARKRLILDYGYDTKAAMHAIRIARMTLEAIREPEAGLRVSRADAEELLAIRDGKRQRDDICREVRSIIKAIDLEAGKSSLPGRCPDHIRDTLIIETVGEYVLSNSV